MLQGLCQPSPIGKMAVPLRNLHGPRMVKKKVAMSHNEEKSQMQKHAFLEVCIKS